MVPDEIGILPEHRGVTGNLPRVNGPHEPKVEKRKGLPGQARAPSPPSPNWTRREGRRPPFPSLTPPLLVGQGTGGESYSR